MRAEKESEDVGNSALTSRARARAQEAALAPLEVEQVPVFERIAPRYAWLSERIAAGVWRADDTKTVAKAWGLSPATVASYLHQASIFVEMMTGDVQRLRVLSALRLQNISADQELDTLPGGLNARVRATELLLKLTGDLAGGREASGDVSEKEMGEQMVEAIRHPDAKMLGWLREALSDPGPELCALLEQVSTFRAEGEEVPEE